MKIQLKHADGKFKSFTLDNTGKYFDKESKKIGILMNVGARGVSIDVDIPTELKAWPEVKFHGKTYYRDNPNDYDILMEKLELELALDKLG